MFDERGDATWGGVGDPDPSDTPSFYEEPLGDEDMEEDLDADLFLTEGVWQEATDILREALADPKLSARAMRLQKRILEDLNELASDLEMPTIFDD